MGPGRRLAGAVGCLLIAATLAPGQPSGDRELATGIRQVEEGSLEDAVTTLDAVARRLAGQPARAPELAQAYLYLGIAYAQLDSERSARASFRQALRHDPGVKLAEDRWPPKVLRAFAAVRAEVPAPASPSPTPLPRPSAAAAIPPPAVAAPPAAGGMALDHKAVACLVAKRYPRLDACIRSADQLAQARAYFRRAGDSRWYYVEMKPAADCLSAVLPQPSPSLVGKRVEYYLDAMDRRLGNARTPEYTPLVVAAAGDCDSGVAAVPLGKAAVSVFPSMPAGFVTAGGVSTKTVVIASVVAAGAATAGLAAASGGGDPPGPTSGGPNPGPLPVTTLPPTTLPPTTTPPPAAPLTVSCSASPRQGTRPLTVQFTSAAEGGTGVHDYSWAFGDGDSASARNPSHTYTSAGNFNARVTVRSGPATNTCERSITVDTGGGPPPTNPPPYFGPGLVRRITWASRLDVPGGQGQVVFNGNGTWISYPGPGLSHGVVDLPQPLYPAVGGWSDADAVRVEAQLVEALDRPGTWRFELEPGGEALVRSGSLRVVAGSVVEVGPRTVTFRLQGRTGERVVFTFRSW